jgi:hypothetical protein
MAGLPAARYNRRLWDVATEIWQEELVWQIS